MEYIKKIFINQKELTVQTWEIYICDYIPRGRFHKIKELYVPEIDLGINTEAGPINTFIVSKERYTNQNNASGHSPKLIKTTKVNGQLMETLESIAALHKLKNQQQKQLVELTRELFET